MSTRAFALFASSSKFQSWVPVVRISLYSALICLPNSSITHRALALPVPPQKTRLRLGYLSRSLPFASDTQQLSIANQECTAVFLVGACCDRGSEAGIQYPHPIQVQRGWPPSNTEKVRTVGRVARF